MAGKKHPQCNKGHDLTPDNCLWWTDKRDGRRYRKCRICKNSSNVDYALLRALLDCDELLLLPGWQDSKGATVEHAVAAALDMPIHELTAPVLRWLQEQP